MNVHGVGNLQRGWAWARGLVLQMCISECYEPKKVGKKEKNVLFEWLVWLV